jgi:PHP family Zn ribbon phosphoesterase
MKHSEHMCNTHKSHATLWTRSLGQATHSICYWNARIIRYSIRNNDEVVLNYYLLRSNVDKERFGTVMTMMACINQLTNLRSQLNDVLKDAKSNGSFRVEKKYPHLTEDNPIYEIERE